MAKKLDQIMAALPAKHRGKIKARAAELATLKDLRQAVAQTQEELSVREYPSPPKVPPGFPPKAALCSGLRRSILR